MTDSSLDAAPTSKGSAWRHVSRGEGTGLRRSAAAVAVALTVATFLTPRELRWLFVAGESLLLAWALRAQDRAGAQLSLLFAILALVGAIPVFGVWPVYLLVPVAVHMLMVRALPRLFGPPMLWPRGAVRPRLLAEAALVLVLSAGGLLLWFLWARPDVSWQLEQIPRWSFGALVWVGLAFAVGNAALEEALYRGSVQGSLAAAGFGPTTAVVLQALAFGASHLHGFPSGAVGVTLASVYGAMLGILRHRAGGVRIPFAAHVATDFVIFSILITQTRS